MLQLVQEERSGKQKFTTTPLSGRRPEAHTLPASNKLWKWDIIVFLKIIDILRARGSC